MPAVERLEQKTRGSWATSASSRRDASSCPSTQLDACTDSSAPGPMPIIPVPTAQAQRVAVAGVGRTPASSNACSAAAKANPCERLPNLRSLRSPTVATASKPLTSAAMRVEKPLASKSVIGAVELRPASSVPHVLATVFPAGVTRPIPVIATRILAPIMPPESGRCRLWRWRCGDHPSAPTASLWQLGMRAQADQPGARAPGLGR